MEENACTRRLDALAALSRRRRLDAVIVENEFNRLALVGVRCDNGVLVAGEKTALYTDFRYTVMARRVAPWLDTRDIWRRSGAVAGLRAAVKSSGARRMLRIGYEGGVSARRYLEYRKAFPEAKLVDVEADIAAIRAVKTGEELERIAAAEALNDRIWAKASRSFRYGMTEKEMQRIVRALMNSLGDGEAFETIVCAGANGAECHHVPDSTVWKRGEPLLVDMGVLLNGACSDMTRCIVPRRPDPEYAKAYAAVLAANEAAIAAVRPGMTGGELDAVARRILEKAGYGAAFGHSLGHGVGSEIHEPPYAAPGVDAQLKPGMTLTIEPGVYLPGRFGIRIEDLVEITDSGCRVLSKSPKKKSFCFRH